MEHPKSRIGLFISTGLMFSLFANALHAENYTAQAINYAMSSGQQLLYISNDQENPFFRRTHLRKPLKSLARGEVPAARQIRFFKSSGGRGVEVSYENDQAAIGRGPVVSKTYQLVGAIDTVAINLPAKVRITQGAQASVTVTTRANLQELIAPRQNGSFLEVVGAGHSFRTDALPEVTVVLPAFTHLQTFGSAEISLDDFKLPRLDLQAGAATVLAASGSYENLRVQATGTSRVDLRRAKVGAADLSAIQASRIDAKVLHSLRVYLADEALAYIDGHPLVLSATTEAGTTLRIR